jgi:fructokinase
MSNQNKILCIGEVLWDALPSGLFLGGAPLNVCYHLNQFGIEADIASRVGDDRLGEEAVGRIKHKGIATKHIQIDQKFETGFVSVELSDNEDPKYDIIEPAAWDHISLSGDLRESAQNSWGLVFGSLAQRNQKSRETIQKLWNLKIKKIFDVNLRPPHVEREIVMDALRVADIVKMNEEELGQLAEWCSISGDTQKVVEKLAQQFDCPVICITHGTKGAILYQEGAWFEHAGFPVSVTDTVGAGDAFLAALLYGIKSNQNGNELLAYANAAGSLVARKEGATPEYSTADIFEVIETK